LEGIYDEYLISTPKHLWRIVLDRRGNIVPGLSFQVEERDVLRNQLVMTLDIEIQRIVEAIMDRHGIDGAVVVMNPHNGDLLAAASRPNYDQNNILAAQGSSLLNKAFQFYFPASVFKILIAAAALEEEVISSTDVFHCRGAYILPVGLSIRCWHREGHGNINLIEAMAYSCNPFFIDIGLGLGRTNILKYSEKLGLTENIIMGYPQNEVNRIDIDFGLGSIANASLGQEGVMITPIQTGVLLSSIANGGYAVTPKVVMEIRNQDGGIVQEVSSIAPNKIWSDSTVFSLKEMLYAVNSWGTGINAWSNEMPSAGKTGSAETGSGLNALFAGYFPADDPEYVIVVVVENGRSGGIDAAPIFREIMEKIVINHVL
jgi:cell division protein FtsI/penicillin-binding protein 2